jgi:hypothetical protein
MKKLHRHTEGEPSAPSPPADRLADVRPMSHDDDERQSAKKARGAVDLAPPRS